MLFLKSLSIERNPFTVKRHYDLIRALFRLLSKHHQLNQVH